LCAALLTSDAYFFRDDYEFLNQARTQNFGLVYLREGLYEHFSPISRLLNSMLVALAPGSWLLAHGVELALYAAALIAFALVMHTILGKGWSAFVLTIIFGQSLFLIRLLFWWTAAANILPASIFMLLSIAGYVGWRKVGSGPLLLGSFAAFALALLDYETAMLLPVYLAVISLLVLEPHLGPRGWARRLWRERWAWTAYLALDAAALVNYYRSYYHAAVSPSVQAVAHYLEIALVQTFLPGLLGIKNSPAPLVVAAVGIVVVAAVAVTLYLRPRAWHCLAAFILVFLVTMLPLGLNKIVRFGVTIGDVYYYQQALQFMFLVLAAFAISPRWSGRRVRSANTSPRASANRGRLLAPRRPSRRALTVVGAAAAVAYATLYLTSLHALVSTTAEASPDRAYVNEYLASDSRVIAAGHEQPMLIDLTVPTTILPAGFRPYTSYGEFLGLFNPSLRLNKPKPPLYVVNPHGRLLPVSFHASARGLIDQASISAPAGSAGVAALGGRIACVPAGQSGAWLSVPLAHPQRTNTNANGLPNVLRVRFHTPTASVVSVVLLPRRGADEIKPARQVWDRGAHGELIPLASKGLVRAVAFNLPPRACIRALALGRLREQRLRRRRHRGRSPLLHLLK
jgi:hypothetical protein